MNYEILIRAEKIPFVNISDKISHGHYITTCSGYKEPSSIRYLESHFLTNFRNKYIHVQVGLCSSLLGSTLTKYCKLKTITMYWVTVLEASLLKGRCAQDHPPSLTCREILCFLGWFAGLLWSSLACSCVPLISAFVITQHFPCASVCISFYDAASQTELGAHPG